MNVTLKDLLDKLGVSYELGPYETCPWSCYDVDLDRTCSAEVRMNPDGDELEGEIQVLKDDPDSDMPIMEPIYFMRAKPGNSSKWTIKLLLIRGEPIDETISQWPQKSCGFFRAVVQELIMDKFPDIDELLDKELYMKERGADQYGGGGGKSPKLKGGQLMGMKKGGGI